MTQHVDLFCIQRGIYYCHGCQVVFIFLVFFSFPFYIYLQIDHVISRFEERMQCGIEVFQWFKTHVIDCKLEPSIGHQELVSKCILPMDSLYSFGCF